MSENLYICHRYKIFPKTMVKEELKNEILRRYCEGKEGQEKIAAELHIGKLKIREVLKECNVPTFSNKQSSKFVVPDYRIKKYKPMEGKHYIAIYRDNGVKFSDYENAGGYLTSYIEKQTGIKTPTLYERRKYYQTTGNYWYERWFDIIAVDDERMKDCPYCGWKTSDVENRGGAFEMHLKNAHGKTLEEYVNEYPSEISYFPKYRRKLERDERLRHKENYVVCPICGERYSRLTKSHIETHGITYDDFRDKYPDVEVMSATAKIGAQECIKIGNLTVSKSRYISRYEREIQKFLTDHGCKIETNRQLLIGREIDILDEERKIGIEFDGLRWHTEFFGNKPCGYHLSKTKQCEAKGYRLIHIFEDEYVRHKDIVYAKLSHIFGFDINLPKIMARKTMIKEILKSDAELFLNKYHVQGFSKATVYLGAYYDDELIAVMAFKNGNINTVGWELTRFASSYHYICQGIGGKMFSYFVRKYNPEKVTSFADRRWTINKGNSLYEKIGFTFAGYTPPNYSYYNYRADKFRRINKRLLNKRALMKKYGFPETMTEKEMAMELGYDRIWDCGLIRYVWKK